MKIIAFGDIHMATSAAATIHGVQDADLLVVTGDLTNFGNRRDAKTVLNQLLEYNRNLLCLAGNLDNSDVNDYLEDLGMNLHGQAHMVRRMVCIYGVGGSNRTPFNTPWEFSEDQLFRLIQESYHQARELIELAEPIVGCRIPTIFVSHTPPLKTTLDRISSGEHVGSQAVRKHIESHRPDLCLTGHIHESRGEEFIETTHVINPGMLSGGGWVEIEVEKSSIRATLK